MKELFLLLMITTSRVQQRFPTTTAHIRITCTADGCDASDSYQNTEPCIYSYAVTTEPTCTTQGYTTYTCSVCGYSYTGDYTLVLEHNYGSGVIIKTATCTADGIKTYTCNDCWYSYTEIIPALGHNYISVVTAPTCTEQGYTTYTCSVCGDTYTSDTVSATAHN